MIITAHKMLKDYIKSCESINKTTATFDPKSKTILTNYLTPSNKDFYETLSSTIFRTIIFPLVPISVEMIILSSGLCPDFYLKVKIKIDDFRVAFFKIFPKINSYIINFYYPSDGTF